MAQCGRTWSICTSWRGFECAPMYPNPTSGKIRQTRATPANTIRNGASVSKQKGRPSGRPKTFPEQNTQARTLLLKCLLPLDCCQAIGKNFGAAPVRLELTTSKVRAWCSIQLSYGALHLPRPAFQKACWSNKLRSHDSSRLIFQGKCLQVCDP